MSEPKKIVAVARPVRVTAARAPQLSRKCPGGKKCPEEEKKKQRLQRTPSGAGAARAAVPPIVGSVLGSPGRPLDDSIRTFMESRLGHDFSSVRIHTGSVAAASARSVGALAYTVGQNIVFDDGVYDPLSDKGRHLLAHELTHTIQQRGFGTTALDSLETSAPGDAYEREADRIAHGALAGTAVGAAVAYGVQPVLARVAAEKPVADPKALESLKDEGIEEVEAIETIVDEQNRVLRRFVGKALELPADKGGTRALDFYRQRSQSGALESIVSPSGQMRSVLKAERSETPDLRKFFLLNIAAAENGKVWQDFLKKPPECEIDHLIELHIGGPDIPANTQLIGSTANKASQTEIRRQIKAIAKAARDAYAKAGLALDEIAVHFKEVTPRSDKKVTDDCRALEEAWRKRALEENNKSEELGQGPETSSKALIPYPLSAGGISQDLSVERGTADTTIEGSTIRSNQGAAGLVAGMRLQTLVRKTKPHTVKASLDTDPKSETRLPVILKNEKDTVSLGVLKGELKLPKEPKEAKANLKFVFPYLSEGTITRLSFLPEGLHASGTITPSFPLLSGVKLDVDIAPGSMTATLSPRAQLKSPIPALHLTNPALRFDLFPEFKPVGSIGFYVGTKAKPLLEGTLQATAEGTEFVASAKATAHVPAVDDAQGAVTYRKHTGWSGNIHAEKSSKALVKSASIDVNLDDNGIDARGNIRVRPPLITDDNGIALDIERDAKGGLAFHGEGMVKLPRLDPVKLQFGYGAAGLTASGKAPFTLFGKKGTLTIAYSQEGFSGAVENFVFNAGPGGRARVEIPRLAFTPKGSFVGEGTIAIPFGEKFTASGSVALSNEKLSVTAALKIAKPIDIFPVKTGSYTFFEPKISIPIPGASIGNVGLKARIIGALSAGYSVGPATLQKGELEVGFDPLAKSGTAGPQVRFQALLVIPARAHITGSITGEVALDILVAEVAGGLTITATAELVGASSFATEVFYSAERFTFDGELKAAVKLLLALGLNAHVLARAGIGPFSKETRKDWMLGRWSFDPGLSLTMDALVRYDSSKPSVLPEPKFNKPTLDAHNLVAGPFGSTKGVEKEGQ